MKKLLLTTAMVLGLSTNANAYDMVRPLNNEYDVDKMTKFYRVITKQPIIEKEGNPTFVDLRKVYKSTSGFRYVEDWVNYKDWAFFPDQNYDYWATPEEMSHFRTGDCEDFALYWYYEARKKGFKPHQLNIWIGFVPELNNQGHAILAVELNGEEYILDSLANNIMPASEYDSSKFSRLYRVNENGWSIK